MTGKYILNAGAAAPADAAVSAGDETLVQLVPLGTWPQWDETGKRFEQVCTEETFQRLIDAFPGEVLVDADHASERGGEARDSRAYAWIQALSIDETGALCGAFRWTDIGAEAVSQRRYRFVSVCWECDQGEEKNEWTPVRLVSVALTNTPNIPARPILNHLPQNNQPPEKETEIMEELKAILGLPPETADDEVIAAAAAALRAAAEEKANAEAEEFAEENKDKVEDAAALKAAYRKNPELAREIVGNIKAHVAAPAVVVCDSTKAKTPVLAAKNALREGLAKCKAGAERAAYVQAHAAEFAAEAHD